jgi:hypothetical protein
MKITAKLFKKLRLVLAAGLLAGAGLFLAGGHSQTAEAQSANSIYLTPAAANYKVGDSFAVEVHVNSSEQINTVEAHLSYDGSLQFVSIDDAGGAFGIPAEKSGGSGQVSLAMGTTAAVSGDQFVAKVNFKAVAVGSGTVQMLDSSQALSSTTFTNVITTRKGGAYAVAAQSSGSGSATTTTTPSTTTTTPTQSGSTSSTAPTKATNYAKVSIAPQGNEATTPLPGDSVVELQAPATIETAPDVDREVSKVEYLLNGKVVSTDTTPPYSHSVDTNKLRNGTYTLTTKTYYKDGKVDSSKASLVVNNPFGAGQLWLQVKHYAWLIALLLIAAGVLVYFQVFRGNGKFPYGKGTGAASSSGHGQVIVGGGTIPGTTIQPPTAS